MTMEPEPNVSVLEIWAYRSDVAQVPADALVGYGVEATDGSIGKVDEATHEVSACYLVVDIGPWILGKKVMLPAGLITTVDTDREVVSVGRSKEEIKNAPPFDPDAYRDEDYRTALASYYAHEVAREEDRLRKTG
jgi:hypothetical protein